MLVPLVVIRVAACAIWLIGAVEPGHHLAVTLVTTDAPKCGIVVVWVVARRVTVREDRGPVSGGVAFVALNRRYKVVAGLARCRDAVVAGRAIAHHRAVIEPGTAEGRRVVATLTSVAGGNVVRRLTDCRTAVVAGRAIARYPAVIEPGTAEGRRVVAVLTAVVGRNMVRRLPLRRTAVVARRAIARHSTMIEHYRPKGRRVVATLTSVAGGNVVRRLPLRRTAVVARRAIARYPAVIETCGREGYRVVAVLTAVVGRNMVRRLPRRRTAVVARRAIARYPAVIETCGREGCRVVAVLTAVVGRNMVRRLPRRRTAVVARETIAYHQAVIESCRRPKGGAVAIVAVVTARNVVDRLAFGSSAVMTVGTRANHRVVVHVGNRSPGTCIEAIVACGSGGDMIDGFSRSGNLSALAVAGLTLPRRTFKNPPSMAAFARDSIVGPCEQKTRREMIKFKPSGLRSYGLRWQEDASTEQQDTYDPATSHPQSCRTFGLEFRFHIVPSSFFFATRIFPSHDDQCTILTSLNDFVTWQRSQFGPKLPRWMSSPW